MAALAGVGIFFSIPKSFTSGGPRSLKFKSLSEKLSEVDYLGAVTLVSKNLRFCTRISCKARSK